MLKLGMVARQHVREREMYARGRQQLDRRPRALPGGVSHTSRMIRLVLLDGPNPLNLQP
jgi:hypothetical protein